MIDLMRDTSRSSSSSRSPSRALTASRCLQTQGKKNLATARQKNGHIRLKILHAVSEMKYSFKYTTEVNPHLEKWLGKIEPLSQVVFGF